MKISMFDELLLFMIFSLIKYSMTQDFSNSLEKKHRFEIIYCECCSKNFFMASLSSPTANQISWSVCMWQLITFL